MLPLGIILRIFQTLPMDSNVAVLRIERLTSRQLGSIHRPWTRCRGEDARNDDARGAGILLGDVVCWGDGDEGWTYGASPPRSKRMGHRLE